MNSCVGGRAGHEALWIDDSLGIECVSHEATLLGHVLMYMQLYLVLGP